MPPSRFRNEVGYCEDLPRGRNNAASASGDSTACTIYQHQDALTRHQNKLPRSVRYELENALVGLCDVWFDEIKPHLVRNNIKLHVSGSSAGGDQQRTRPLPPASPVRRVPPSSALSDDCSHLDPASSSGCKLCQLLVTAASFVERAGWEAADTSTPSPVSSDFYASDTSGWCSRAPLHCLTVPYLHDSTAVCPRQYRFIVPRRESVMKNKTTQTEPVLRESRACQSRSPGVRNPCYCSSGSRSPGLRSPGLRSPGLRSPGPSSPGLRSSAPRSTKRSPISSSPDSSSPDRALSPLVPPAPVICQLKRSEVAVAELPSLLQDDLIDIIAASNENRLRLLYSSSERDDHPSFLNLFPNCKPERMSLKKLPPWR